MTDVNNEALVKSLLDTANENTGGDLMDTLQYAYAGNVVEGMELLEDCPDDWTFTVREVNTKTTYTSYGNSYSDDSFIIVEVADYIGNKALYKIPGSYASYDGWDWELHKISRVEKREKVVKSWEWRTV
jgi:hypothetical protein